MSVSAFVFRLWWLEALRFEMNLAADGSLEES
jgi:hypothetical protein